MSSTDELDCPTITELAAWVEAGRDREDRLARHVDACQDCTESIAALLEEVASLQIPLSEIWFREHVSCPHRDTLREWRQGALEKAEADYVRFHVEDLGCPHCQARAEQIVLEADVDAKRIVRASRSRTREATSRLLEELGREDSD